MTTTSKEEAKKYFKIGFFLFLVILAGGFAVFLVFRFSDFKQNWDVLLNILQPVILGLGFAYILDPAVRFNERVLNEMFPKIDGRKKLRRAAGILIAVLITLFIFVILGILVVPQLLDTCINLLMAFPTYIQDAEKWMDSFFANETVAVLLNDFLDQTESDILTMISEKVMPFFSDLVETLALSVAGILSGLLDLIIAMIIAIYVLFTKETMAARAKKILHAALTDKVYDVLWDVLKKADELFSGFITGNLIDAAIIGCTTFVFLMIFQMPYATLIAVIIGVTNIIPFFGPFIGAVPASLLLLVEDPVKMLWFVVWIIFIQQMDGNVIKPKVLGVSTGVSAFWVLVSILVFGGLFGVVGMLLAVPAFGVIYYIVKLVVEYRLKKKGMSISTEDYRKEPVLYKPRGRKLARAHSHTAEQGNEVEAAVSGEETCTDVSGQCSQEAPDDAMRCSTDENRQEPKSY